MTDDPEENPDVMVMKPSPGPEKDTGEPGHLTRTWLPSINLAIVSWSLMTIMRVGLNTDDRSLRFWHQWDLWQLAGWWILVAVWLFCTVFLMVNTRWRRRNSVGLVNRLPLIGLWFMGGLTGLMLGLQALIWTLGA